MEFGNVGASVLGEGAQQEKGENARMASFMGAFAMSHARPMGGRAAVDK